MQIVIHQSKKVQKSLVIAAMIGQNLAKGFQATADDAGKRSILLAAYVDAVREMVEANEAGDAAKTADRYDVMGRIGKSMAQFDLAVTAKRNAK